MQLLSLFTVLALTLSSWMLHWSATFAAIYGACAHLAKLEDTMECNFCRYLRCLCSLCQVGCHIGMLLLSLFTVLALTLPCWKSNQIGSEWQDWPKMARSARLAQNDQIGSDSAWPRMGRNCLIAQKGTEWPGWVRMARLDQPERIRIGKNSPQCFVMQPF